MKTARASTLAAPADVEAVDVKGSARADGPAAGKEEAAAATPGLTTAILLSSAGNVLEWMDFSIYAFMAKQIGRCQFVRFG